MIKEKGLDWKAFDLDNTNLSRIDLYYDRKFKKSDEIETFDSFLEECRSQIEKAIFSIRVFYELGDGEVVIIFVFIDDLMEKIFDLSLN